MKDARLPLLSALLLALILPTLTSCQVDDTQQLPERSYELVWSDEFDGDAGTAPDPEKWIYNVGTGQNGWGNGELQYYTDRTDNAALDGDGHLVITARREGFAGAGFTSARLTTEGKFQQTYGRFEARLKTPYGPGIWPAFWMLGADYQTNTWPQCGEIDLMELRGQEPSVINGTVHGPGYSAGNAVGGTYALENGRYDEAFHVFAVEWEPESIDFYVDEVLYRRITPDDVPGEWVYDHDFFLLLNIAVGGNYVGFPTSQTPFPQEMIVDYVRVLQRAD